MRRLQSFLLRRDSYDDNNVRGTLHEVFVDVEDVLIFNKSWNPQFLDKVFATDAY